MLNKEKIIDVIEEAVTSIMRLDTSVRLNESVNLTSLGLNSLERVDLICMLEQEFSTHIPDEQISDLETIADIINFLSNKTD